MTLIVVISLRVFLFSADLVRNPWRYNICCNTFARESGDYHSSLWHTGSGNWCYKRNNTWVGT